MKNFLPTLLPALSLLALGGCAGTAAVSSTENDGVYYSSQDRTTQTRRAVATRSAAENPTADELTNPDYAGESSASAAPDNTEYYDEEYTYSSRIRRFHQPYYRGFGYGYNDFIYADPFWYGGPGYYSAWGPSYGGFYDPFWGPTWGGSYVNINIGFGNPYWGRPWGWNRWGGYGYGRGFYDGYYSGLYGGGYGNFYGGGGYYGGVGTGTVRNVRYGPRSGRSAEATTAGRPNTTAPAGRGRVSQGGIVAPGGTTAPTGGLVGNGGSVPTSRSNTRVRPMEETPGATASPAVRGGRTVQLADQATSPALQPNATQKAPNTRYQVGQDAANDAASPTRVAGEGRRWRVAPDAATGGQSAPTSSPDYSQPRRGRSIFNSGGGQSGGQTADQPVRRQQRTFEAPQQRTYDAPQRSYSPPSRSEPSRSYSPPSGGGGNGGGGRGRVN